MNPECPFCHPEAGRVLSRGLLTVTLLDAYPVAEGHALVTPARHVAATDPHSPASRMPPVRRAARPRGASPGREP